MIQPEWYTIDIGTKHLEPVFLDTETTGFNPFTNELLEVAIIDIQNKVLLHHSLEYSGPIEEDALRCNHWHTRALRNDIPSSISHEDMARRLQNILKDKVIVGSNPTFDILFLQKFIWDQLQEYPSWYYRSIDISAVRYDYEFMQLLGLSTLCERNLMSTDSNHTALQDARSVRALFIKWIQDRESCYGSD